MKKSSKEEVWEKISETEVQRQQRELTKAIEEVREELERLHLYREVDVSKFKTTI